MTGIVGYGAYIPGLRITTKEIRAVWPGAGSVAGVQERAVADLDEDVITMAVAAAERALEQAGLVPEEVQAVYLATTSAPYEEKSAAAVVQVALGLPAGTLAVDVGGSTRAGTLALRLGQAQVEAGHAEVALVIASDNRRPALGDPLEQGLGAGAVALVVGRERVLAEISGWSSVTEQVATVWRPYGEKWLRRQDDGRFEREYGYLRCAGQAGRQALAALYLEGGEVACLAASEPDGRSLANLARTLGLPREATQATTLAPMVGDTGAAAPLLGLVAALEEGQPGQRVLVISYGPGAGSDAFGVSLTQGLEAKRGMGERLKEMLAGKTYLSYPAYAKRAGYLPVPQALPDPVSTYLAQPSMWREEEALLGLAALECEQCGSLNFPQRHYCIDCRGTSFRRVKLPRRGEIVTYNVQYVLPISPEEAPVVVCTVRLAGAKGLRGGKVSGAMVAVDPAQVRVGLAVELVFRRCGEEWGLPKYGYKFKPLSITGEGAGHGARAV